MFAILLSFMERAEIMSDKIEVVESGLEANGSELRKAVSLMRTPQHLSP